MLTAESTLAVFAIFGISSLAIFWAKKFKLPHTVFLVFIGLIIGLVSHLPFFSFFQEFSFTPELLFFLLLPTLIFESAYNINIRKMIDDFGAIMILSIVGLAVSTLIIGVALYYLLGLFGLYVPFIVTLIFGAIISATDPVAVLALFKEFGAPRRLSLIFEGESLFNDATAVALFFILLGIATHGYNGLSTINEGVLSFSSMLLGGVIFGLIMGLVFTKLVGYTRNNEIASITLTIVLAHATFLLAEISSNYLTIGDLELPSISPIIATTVASLFMGNYGRSKIHPKAEEFVEKLWAQLAFLSNSLIFILIGILSIPIIQLNLDMFLVILATVLIVAIARAISIYPIIGIYNKVVKVEKRIQKSWQHLLSWGSLRGAIAVTMVLLIPDDLTFANWALSISPNEFLLSLTIGCIFATLFIKATSIKRVMNRLKLDRLTEIEKVEIQEARAIIHHEVGDRISTYQSRGYIDTPVANELAEIHKEQYEKACRKLCSPDIKQLSHRVLRMYAIGIERKHLKELYHHNEVSEQVYRTLYGKLQLQLEAIENGNLAPDMSLHTDKKDIFNILEKLILNLIGKNTDKQSIDDLFMYYRAQAIISRKVLKEINSIDEQSANHIFNKEAVDKVVALYTNFKERSEQKMNDVALSFPDHYHKLSLTLASRGVGKIQENVLHDLYERELITPKLYIKLSEEIEEKR